MRKIALPSMSGSKIPCAVLELSCGMWGRDAGPRRCAASRGEMDPDEGIEAPV